MKVRVRSRMTQKLHFLYFQTNSIFHHYTHLCVRLDDKTQEKKYLDILQQQGYSKEDVKYSKQNLHRHSSVSTGL